MDFLLLKLTLGCFVLVLPFSSEEIVELELPQYLAVSSTMKINCSFITNRQPYKLVLENGHQALEAPWDIGKDTYVYDDVSGITLNWKLNSPQDGRYSFVFSRQLSCSDFTWYRCKVERPEAFSSNKTLQVAPEITSVALSGGGSASQPFVNEFSIFLCAATIPKEGSYSVKWFKGSTPSRNELSGGQTQVLRQNKCTRTIKNELRYNVTESDMPILILTCQLTAGQITEETESFLILFAPEITSVALSGGGSASPPFVNEFSTFLCVATIPKEGSYSVKWFKESTPSRNELSGGQTQLLRQNEYNRTIKNELRYNVTESDMPILILTCQLTAGKITEETESFLILDSTFRISNKVKIEIPPSAVISSTMEVKCTFKTTKAILKMVLENGNQQLVAFYDFDVNNYVLVETDGVNLELNHDSTRKYGYFTFVFSRLKYSDFTWYRCKADDGVPIFSANKTLQGSTEIEMPSYANVSMEVHCSFKSAKPLLKMILEKGNVEFVAAYNFDLKTYAMVETPGVTLKVNVDQSKKEGRFTFFFSQLNKNDFTWYRCKAENDINVFSTKKTLEAWETYKANMAVSVPASLFLSLSLVLLLSM